MRTTRHRLTPKARRDLETSINSFKTWLAKTKKFRLDAAAKYKRVTFPDPTSEDWIMRVEGEEAQFNTYLAEKGSFDFFRFVVLHECFHLFVQDVPNKSDAKRLKDDFGDVVMRLLDVEADYYTAIYFKEIEHASLVDLFTLFYEGSRVFADPRIRAPKIERFIGTVLSVAKAYFKNPGDEELKESDLYLPNISNIPTEDTIHILISTKDHFIVGEIQADCGDFKKMKMCYGQLDRSGLKKYCDTLLQFAKKALGLDIPTVILKQFEMLKDPNHDHTPRV